MSDHHPYIRLPTHLFSGPLAVLAAEPHDDEQFAAHEVEFIRHLFGRCAFLREHARETPVSDAFLSVFVNLIDTLQANAPEEARQCAMQLRQVIQVVFPDLPPQTDLQIARFTEPLHLAATSSHNGASPTSESE